MIKKTRMTVVIYLVVLTIVSSLVFASPYKVVSENFADMNFVNWITVHGDYGITFNLESGLHDINNKGANFLALSGNIVNDVRNYVSIYALKTYYEIGFTLQPVSFNLTAGEEEGVSIEFDSSSYAYAILTIMEYATNNNGNISYECKGIMSVNGNTNYTLWQISSNKEYEWMWFTVKYEKSVSSIDVSIDHFKSFDLSFSPTKITMFGFHFANNKWDIDNYVLAINNIYQDIESKEEVIYTSMMPLMMGVTVSAILVAVILKYAVGGKK